MSEELNETKKEKITIRISPSTLDSAQKCWRYFYFTKVLNLEPIERNYRLDKGSFIHLLLECYYTSIKNGNSKSIAYNETILKARDQGLKLNLENSDTEEVIKAFTSYHNAYIHDNWKPLFVEQPFSYVLYEDDKYIILLEGKIDLVAIIPPHEENVIIIDHKSGEQNRDTGPLSNQFEGYCIAFDRQEVVRNFIGFQKDENRRFARSIKSYNEEMLAESKEQMILWAFEIYNKLSQPMNKYTYPVNRKSCPFCEFQNVCTKGPSDREFVLTNNYQVRKPHDLFGRERGEK